MVSLSRSRPVVLSSRAMGTRTVLSLLIVAALAAGCAAAPRHNTSSKPQRASESKPYDFRSEGKLPPAGADKAPVEADVEEIPLTDGSLEVSEAEAPPRDTLQVAAPADSTTDGFRVQIFASADREVAENAARAVQQRLGVAAYTELEGGMYKVRAGDYLTRADAETALATMRRHYYPDAWIVATRVVVLRRP